VENSRLVAVGGAGKGLKAVQRDGGDEPIVGVGEGKVAGHLRTDGLRVVIVEDQPVDVAGQIFDICGDAGLGRKVFAAEGNNVHATLVDEFRTDRSGQVAGGLCGCGRDGGADLLFHATVEQGIPADDEVVEARALVAEVAVGRPAALAVVFGADDHVHAAVDDPVNLLAHDEALDG
jgi:hypothetical protein